MLTNTVHIDQALSDFAIGYAQEPSAFIAEQVAPVVNVAKMTDKYWVGGKESFKDPGTSARRGPGAEFGRVELAISTDSYTCEGYGLEAPVAQEEQANADNGINPEQEATALVVDLLKLNYERRVAALVQSGSVFTNTAALAAADRWDNAASDPIATVQTYKETIRQLIGREPNTLVIGQSVYSKLRQHPDIIERTKYTQLGTMVNEKLIAQFFDIDKVLVGKGIYDTAIEGLPVSMSDIWGKIAWLAYVDPNVGPFRRKVTCPIRTFVWTGSPSNGRFGVDTYYEPQRKSDIVQVTDYTDEKVVDVNTAFLMTTVIS